MNLYAAHVKWFVDPESVKQVSATPREFLLIAAAALVGLAILYLVDKKTTKLNQDIYQKLAKYRPYIPTVVGVSFGLMLIVFAFQGVLLTPNVHLHDAGSWANALRIIEFIIGLMLTLGFLIRPASVGLDLLTLFGLVLLSPVSLLEHLEYVGAAALLYILGAGKLSLDSKFHIDEDPIPHYKNYALPILKIMTGISFVVLAFTEKLANLNLAEKFLAMYHWNLLTRFGVSDHTFILVAGTIELILGVALIINLAPRLVSAVLLGVMTLTAILLGPTEVVGHLFALGVTFAIWVGTERTLGESKLSLKNLSW